MKSQAQKFIEKYQKVAKDIIDCIVHIEENPELYKMYLWHSDNGQVISSQLYERNNRYKELNYFLYQGHHSILSYEEHTSPYIVFDTVMSPKNFNYIFGHNGCTKYSLIDDIDEEWYFQNSLISTDQELKARIIMNYLYSHWDTTTTGCSGIGIKLSTAKRLKTLVNEVKSGKCKTKYTTVHKN